MQAKLSKKQHECEVLQANQRTLQRDLEQLKMDNKGMVQLMANMEKKIGEFVAREDRTNKVHMHIRVRNELCHNSSLRLA